MSKKYYLFQKNKAVFGKTAEVPAPIPHMEMASLHKNFSQIIIPEVEVERNIFTAELPGSIILPEGYTQASLRSFVGRVEDDMFHQWGRAAQILHWYKSHKFCGSCGAATIKHPSDFARLCTECETLFYPKISPCVIVLVHKNNKVLLARSPRFPEKMYSTLAGFIEPGESAEQTLHREIQEEVGVTVKNIRYFKSQSWPFPSQLMLGYFAEYDSGKITIDGEEICDAGWFSIDGLPEIPNPATIAGQLINHYSTSLYTSESACRFPRQAR